MADANPVDLALQARLELAFQNPKHNMILPWEPPTALNQLPVPGLSMDIPNLLEAYIEDQLEHNTTFSTLNPLHRGRPDPFVNKVGAAITKGAKEAKFK